MLCLLFQNEVSHWSCNRSPVGLCSDPYPAVIPLVLEPTGARLLLWQLISALCMWVSAAYGISLDCSGKVRMGCSALTASWSWGFINCLVCNELDGASGRSTSCCWESALIDKHWQHGGFLWLQQADLCWIAVTNIWEFLPFLTLFIYLFLKWETIGADLLLRIVSGQMLLTLWPWRSESSSQHHCCLSDRLME